ncbi:leucyl aminopeptidase family protein [Pseudonocardia spinosispora]|uniref:leucyl aminopeptidase family protein n=1 Tax=Pseudonocardia spinosispora TaxID=103441 RepID=UPI00041A10F3|nr:leucyl aminopeptidase family protein [Pseudonocardia spinosispora]
MADARSAAGAVPVPAGLVPSPVPDLPTSLLTVAAVARPDDTSVRVVLLTGDGDQTDLDGSPVESGLLDTLGATGKAGQVHALPDGRLLLGVGDGSDVALRRAGASLSGALRSRAERGADEPGSAELLQAALAASELPEAGLSALVIGLVLGSYQFRVSHKARSAPGRVELVTTDPAAVGARIEAASAKAWATAVARDLANTPSDVKTPTWLVRTAERLANEIPGLSTTTWSVEQLTEQGFGGLLAVGGGSTRPPAFLRVDWAPGDTTDSRHLVLIGKGITFDTGGISIKPAAGMHLMRTDMAGGAAVIGAILAIARLGVPMRVTALVPAAENHVSGSAYRPGDIVRHYDGTTTEVTNTDAEGRMVLADAIGYAVAELEPDLIVDAATLTGAMKVALGMRTGGLLASDDDLADALLAASARTGEQLWRMPLLDHVAEEVPSEIADLRQAPPGPGGIGAALFLREFTRGVPWAHLDIAGPARCEKAYDEVAVGATGFAARTLVELALGYAGS